MTKESLDDIHKRPIFGDNIEKLLFQVNGKSGTICNGYGILDRVSLSENLADTETSELYSHCLIEDQEKGSLGVGKENGVHFLRS